MDIVVDAAFVAFDLAGLAFGPEKDRAANAAALGADVAAAFVPCVTGAGLVVRAGRHVDEVGDTLRWADEAIRAAGAR